MEDYYNLVLQVLSNYEWIEYEYKDRCGDWQVHTYCPVCDQDFPNHAEDCKREKLLKQTKHDKAQERVKEFMRLLDERDKQNADLRKENQELLDALNYSNDNMQMLAGHKDKLIKVVERAIADLENYVNPLLEHHNLHPTQLMLDDLKTTLDSVRPDPQRDDPNPVDTNRMGE